MEHLDSSRSRQSPNSRGGEILARKIARFIGRKPLACLLTSLSFCSIITVVVVTAGNLQVTFSNVGWKSRGTTIGNREMQSTIALHFQEDLFWDDFISNKFPKEAQDTYSSPWTYLQENVVPGYVDLSEYDRRLARDMKIRRIEESCNTTWYLEPNLIRTLLKSDDKKLVAVWKIHHDVDEKTSFLHPTALLEICKAEETTKNIMGENGFCDSCDNGTCPSPYSLVTLMRAGLESLLDGTLNTCEELVAAYSGSPQVQATLLELLLNCSNSLTSATTGNITTASCAIPGFSPHLVDKDFGVDKVLKYTSSIFYSSSWFGDDEVQELYDLFDSFGKGDGTFATASYDTYDEDLLGLQLQESLFRDTAFAFASSLVTTFAMYIHTKSLWLTVMGLLQILFAAPLSYFVYYFCVGLSFFPIINCIGLFVSAALGADDLFVAVDKWKNARLSNPLMSTEDIAEIALREAAGAMLLTTSTTGVAFFATCITPVPPIFTFALFCGLMVIFNYILNCCLVFPALCLYDKWLIGGSKNCLIASFRKKRVQKQETDEPAIPRESEEENISLIHRTLGAFYEILHRFRFQILVIFAACVAVSTYFASTIKLPENSDVRMLPSRNIFEQHYDWSRLLLSSELIVGSSTVRVFWGLKAADTGDHRNPYTLTTLELDDTFEPKSKDAQEYLKDFCERFWENDFVQEPTTSSSNVDAYKCPINAFEDWLIEQAALPLEAKHPNYIEDCDSANSLPMDEDYFHSCFTTWIKSPGSDGIYTDRNTLSREGFIKIMWCEVRTPVRFTDPLFTIDKGWKKYESWFRDETLNAPPGVNRSFHSGPIWWWKDTTGQMLDTAISAAAIAIGFSAVIVLFSSKSLRLTLFSGLCIIYILVAAAACLVGVGWELGFLESVCFAILIGISCDFVIHFGHAYLLLSGCRTKEERTKNALIHMGPSILAAAFTTFAAALVMLFCNLLFFTKFAQMLLFTITHAILGSFVGYLVLTDTFGPREPTKLYDNIITRLTVQNMSETTE